MSKKHPYVGMPDYQFWKNEQAITQHELFDPITNISFKIGKNDSVVTAGSCFAQHVAKYLSNSGFTFYVTEFAHPIIPTEIAAKFNYGVFTARYGNIYTARQLKQLLDRAYGFFEPIESVWLTKENYFVDPFRPQIQEGGFVSEAELLMDRQVHYAAVRKAIESMSVFVFTLGLTESWIDVRDGAIFPLAPGVAGGVFTEAHFAFKNFEVDEIVEDMQSSIDFIRARNPNVKFVITVSPVPLNATAIDRHVFVSTTYSKAVLRVAAEKICNGNDLCDYFPSFEIITSPYARGRYYGPDCREVTESGVNHVMSVFLKQYGEFIGPDRNDATNKDVEAAQQHIENMESLMSVLCDEEQITNQ